MNPPDDTHAAAAAPFRDPRFAEGVARFERGEYFDAHESWEELWRAEPAGPARTVLQGLIIAAAGFHKLFAQSRPASARRMLARARAKLASAPGAACGLDLDALADALARWAEVHLDGAPERCEPGAYDRGAVPALR